MLYGAEWLENKSMRTIKPKRIFKSKKCRTPNCRKATTAGSHSPYCSNCRTRHWRSKFPLHYYFNKLKQRAKERKKEFELTRAQYVHFAQTTNYAVLKGKTSMSLSIDRRDNSGPYAWWNIDAIRLSENSRKEHVPFWQQQHASNYKPTEEEIKEAESAVGAII